MKNVIFHYCIVLSADLMSNSENIFYLSWRWQGVMLKNIWSTKIMLLELMTKHMMLWIMEKYIFEYCSYISMSDENTFQEDRFEIWGYKRSFLKSFFTFLLIICTGGILGLLFYWLQHWWVYCTHSICSIKDADIVLSVVGVFAFHLWLFNYTNNDCLFTASYPSLILTVFFTFLYCCLKICLIVGEI